MYGGTQRWLSWSRQSQICSWVPFAVVQPVDVQAPARADVDQLPRRGDPPLLRRRAVAVEQLDLRAVGGAGRRHVHALAQRPDRAVGLQRPVLRRGVVAVVQLDRRAVVLSRFMHVDALARQARDLPRAAVAAGARPRVTGHPVAHPDAAVPDVLLRGLRRPAPRC